jgi:hypothetical protein
MVLPKLCLVVLPSDQDGCTAVLSFWTFGPGELKTYVNDSQKLAFATSHFVIELLPFDYLSNQKQ